MKKREIIPDLDKELPDFNARKLTKAQREETYQYFNKFWLHHLNFGKNVPELFEFSDEFFNEESIKRLAKYGKFAFAYIIKREEDKNEFDKESSINFYNKLYTTFKKELRIKRKMVKEREAAEVVTK